MEQFHLFWRGPFSQWHKSDFIDDEGVKYNCCEQYMMAKKAELFGDIEVRDQIMATSNPREQKALGRKVKGFKEDTWNDVACMIVYAGNYCKFTQDERLLQSLLATDDKTLVEASPYDKIWGIGMGEEDPRCQSRDTWDGKNWLGETLTKLKKDLQNED